MRYEFVKAEKAIYPVSVLCHVLLCLGSARGVEAVAGESVPVEGDSSRSPCQSKQLWQPPDHPRATGRGDSGGRETSGGNLEKLLSKTLRRSHIEIFYNRQRRHSTLGYLSPHVRCSAVCDLAFFLALERQPVEMLNRRIMNKRISKARKTVRRSHVRNSAVRDSAFLPCSGEGNRRK